MKQTNRIVAAAREIRPMLAMGIEKRASRMRRVTLRRKALRPVRCVIAGERVKSG
jgi:hypothetical protein